MFQRVQSLYMGLASILLSLCFLLPELQNIPEGLGLYELPVSLALTLLMLLLILFNLFNFKKRKSQFILGRLIILLGFAVFFYDAYLFTQTELLKPGYALVAPLPVIILISLANKAIQKDEELVRSVDRFR